MNHEEILLDLGLNKTEVRVYLTLLELGNTTVGKMAERSKIYRANIYDALEHLIKKGLVAYQQGDKSKTYETTDPANLLLMLKKKENQLNDIMPELKLKREMSQTITQTTILKGLDAFWNVFTNFLNSYSTIYSYGIPKKVPNEIIKTRIPHFHKERLKRKIVMKHIYNYNARERIDYLNNMEYTEAKFLEQEYDSDVTTHICGEEVVLVMWDKPIKTIRIRDARLAKTYTKYFEILWKQAKYSK